jgi:hypothetical protein
MIIKLIPETEDEKKELVEREYSGVKDYFIFGQNNGPDGEVNDFHDWRTQSYRYLIGSIKYFDEIVTNEMREALRKRSMNSVVPQFQMLDAVEQPKVEEVEEKTE